MTTHPRRNKSADFELSSTAALTNPLRRFSRLDFASFAECARINRAMSALILMGGLWADLAGIDATHAH
jgi:hypothetical protein